MATTTKTYKWSDFYDVDGISAGKLATAYDIPNCLALLATNVPFFTTSFEHTTGEHSSELKTIAANELPGIGDSTTYNKETGIDARSSYAVTVSFINTMLSMASMDGVALRSGTFTEDEVTYSFDTKNIRVSVLTGSQAAHTYASNQGVCLIDLAFEVEYDYDVVGYTLTAYTGTSGNATAASMTYTSGSFVVRVLSNQAWTGSSNQTWATLSNSTGSGDNVISVTLTANGGSSTRNATITFTGEHNQTCQISIAQSANSTPPPPSHDYKLVVELTNDDDYQMYPGGHATATASIYDGSTYITDVTDECTWSSDDTSIATVNNSNNKGYITGVATGNTNITAYYNGTYGNFNDDVYIDVIPVPTYSISVSPSSLTGLATAQTSQSVRVYTTNQNWAFVSKPDWITSVYPQNGSNDTSVSFYVQENGGSTRDGNIVFTGTVEGSASVYVQQTGSSTVFFNVYIDDGTSGSTTSVTINDTVTCVALYGPGAQDVTTSVTWELDDNTMGSIDSNGVFTPASAGTVKITASYGAQHSNNYITVNVTSETVTTYSLEVTPSYQTLQTGVTETVQYTAKLYTWINGVRQGAGDDVTTSVYTNWSLASTTYCTVGNTTSSNRGKVTLNSSPASNTSTTITARYRNNLYEIDESDDATVYIDAETPSAYITVNNSTEDISRDVATGSSYEDVTVYGYDESWSASSDSNWLTVSRATGSSDTEYTVRISWSANEGQDRPGTITFTGSEEYDTISFTVEQDGANRHIEVDGGTSDIDVDKTSAGGYVDVVVQGYNETWTATSSDSTWLTVSPTTGASNTSVNVRISWTLNDGFDRTGTITFTGQYGDTIEYTVNQGHGTLTDLLVVTAADSSVESGDETQFTATYKVKNGNNVIILTVDVTDDSVWTITAGSSYGSIGRNDGSFTAGTVSSTQNVTVKATYDSEYINNSTVTGNTTIQVTVYVPPVVTHSLEVVPGSYTITRTGTTTCTVYYYTYEDDVEVNCETIPNTDCTWNGGGTYATINKGTITGNNIYSYEDYECFVLVLYSGETADCTVTVQGLPSKTVTVNLSRGLFENDSNHGSGEVTINSMDCTITCTVTDASGRTVEEEEQVVYATFDGSLAAASNVNYPTGTSWTLEDGSMSFSKRIGNSGNSTITVSVEFDRIDTDGGGGSGISGTATATAYSWQSSVNINLPTVTWQNL